MTETVCPPKAKNIDDLALYRSLLASVLDDRCIAVSAVTSRIAFSWVSGFVFGSVAQC